MNNKKLRPILFAHSGGAQGNPGQGSFDLVSYLQKEVSGQYEVHYPLIENPEEPTYEMWQDLFSKEFSKIKDPVILIGHSLGGSMLLKYLSEENIRISISGLFLIAAPLWGKNGWDVDDFELQENFGEVLQNIPNIYLYHCRNDEFVPFEHLKFYKKAFPNAVIRELSGKDHAFAKGLPELVLDIREIQTV
jgi:predicted alpha/beta hydrolase family esterase